MVYMPHWPTAPLKPSESGLENVIKLLNALANPHLNLPPTIHIAGTNGKGSTAAYFRAIFESAGYKVHCYTSPHLIDFNERIVLASDMISNDYLFDICERTRIKAEELSIQPKIFEGTTVAAFLAFAEVKADVLILETGMGGRLDPTNVVPAPALTVLTPVSFDHMEYLGPTLPIIAAEKGGIIRPGVPCVVSQQEDEVYEIFADICEQLRAPIFAYGYDFGVEKCENGFKVLGIGMDDIIFPFPSLAGDHQIVNAATVIAAMVKANCHHGQVSDSEPRSGIQHNDAPLCGWFFNPGPRLGGRGDNIGNRVCHPGQVSDSEPRSGIQHNDAPLRGSYFPGFLPRGMDDKHLHAIASTKWKGRIEKIELSSGVIWADGAHNPAGAHVLSIWMQDNLPGPISLIVGLTKNRDVRNFLSNFVGVVDHIYAVQVKSEPSSYSAEALANLASEVPIPVTACQSLQEALDKTHLQSRVLTGSLFLIADLYKLMGIKAS